MWVVHGDLHEARVVASLEYVATTVIHIKPQIHLPGQMLETQHKRETRRYGRIYVRQKKRNGRVREQVEEFQIENSGVKFAPVTLMTEMHQAVSLISSIPKVQFNLDLSDKEREDRSKVVLPFEHQGDGKEVRIYDGRPDSVQSTFGSLNVVNGGSRHPEVVGSVAHKPSGVGEIHYLRDSDDERPDSDEDPDDDLDI
jgi:elongator complex protein 5